MKYDFAAQNSLNMKTYLLKFTCMQVLNKMFQQKLTRKGFSVINIHKIATTSERLFWWAYFWEAMFSHFTQNQK